METLNVSGITLQGFAQGGIRTSVAVPEVGAIFDVGTVLPNALRFDHIFVTHGHPDHIGALQSLVGRRDIQSMKAPNVYVPRPIARPLERIFDLWREVNGGRGRGYNVNIVPVDVGQTIRLPRGIEVHALKTYHTIDTVGWGVEQTTKKLKPIYRGLDGKDIAALRKQGVDVHMSNKNKILCVPGDTMIEFLKNEQFAQQAKVLLHEVTIWSKDASTVQKTRRFGHTHIDEMLEVCRLFRGEALVLVHRSMKHSRKEIEDIAKKRFPKDLPFQILFFDGGDRKGQQPAPAMPL